MTLSSNLKKYLSKEITQATRKNGGNLMQLAGMPSTNGIKKNGILKRRLDRQRLHQRICEIMTEIRLEHVSYAYGQDRILEDINLKSDFR